MTIEDVVNLLNFWINKKTGSYLTPTEIINSLDSAQMSLYSDYKAKYATSQLVKDIMSPFRATYDFTTGNTVSGYVVIPSNSTYLDLLDIQISYALSNRTVYYPVPVVNEDVRASRLNSQIDPVTVTSPIAEQTAPRYFRLYPTSGYTGTVTYLRRPIKPVFAYTTISARVIVYDAANSVQLEWRESELQEIILKSLMIIGVNLDDSELLQIASAKTADNYQNINRL